LGENEACHGVAEGEAGHPCPRLYQVENYALASLVTPTQSAAHSGGFSCLRFLKPLPGKSRIGIEINEYSIAVGSGKS